MKRKTAGKVNKTATKRKRTRGKRTKRRRVNGSNCSLSTTTDWGNYNSMVEYNDKVDSSNNNIENYNDTS